MPIVQTYQNDYGDNSKEEFLKRQLLDKIASASTKCEVSMIQNPKLITNHVGAPN